MSKTTVLYKDVAPAAERDASLSTNGAQDFSQTALLPPGDDGAAIISLERNRWLLNGKFAHYENRIVGFWSTEISDKTGLFQNAPVITVEFSQQHSSVGVTLHFDVGTGEYCPDVNIKWYQQDTLKADVNFHPDSVRYFCEKTVTRYDKIVITLKRTSLPGRYAKLPRIIFGVFREFGMADLRSASVVNQMDGIAETLPVSTFNWTLDSREDVDYMFQLKQPVEIRNDGNLLGVYYIDRHVRKTKQVYDIEGNDAIGVLDESVFAGGVYVNKSAKELLAEIIGADFEIEYASDVEDTTLSGILQSVSKRSAVQQVLFAWGVCMATDGSRALRVFNLDDSLTAIGKGQTFFGVTVETDAIVTEVRVTAHSYTEDTNGGIEVGGKKYTDIQAIYTVSSPDVTATDKQNVKEFRGATLVSPSIAQSVAQRIYNWYLRRSTAKADIVWKGEALGDYVSFPNSWGGSNAGSITKMEIKLSNTVVSKCKAVGE